MKTYKHRYRDLKREYDEIRNLKPAYFNAMGELNKLRGMIDAIYEENPEKFSCLIKEYTQLYRRDLRLR